MKNATLSVVPQRFIFNDQEIDFEVTGNNIMVNATQMAKIFDKDVFQFTRIEGTKSFIESCLKPQNCGLLDIENEEDLIVSVQKSGTWMHRVLALKFAAWLNSDFEVWVYHAVDELLFGHYRELEDMLMRSAETRNKIDQLR
jgi:alanine-alpha-ketoisovalerate/valine-pyruvate aminotransferase